MILALYPASFDPVTNGHLDVARRAAALFDELVVAAFDAPSKNLLFTTEERVAMIKEALKDLQNVRVESYTGLTAHHAVEIGAKVIVRGLRTVSDFEWELQLAQNYRHIAPNLEIACLMTSQNYSFMSSSMVKEIAKWGGDVSQMVPPHVMQALYQRYGRSER
ncbi:MAG TPA: pantetheine-phosphate adenylyltransferase [Chloroflexia bacterium]|nr:pantetheine-phosphate adenylyltransferase [Chloroflexia bacterium]